MKKYNTFRKTFRKVLTAVFCLALVATLFCVICSATDGGTTGMGTVLSDFIELLTSGISELATGIGSGVNEYVQELFLEVNTQGQITGLSTFGGVIAIFGGIALAVGLTTLIFNWIKSIGN